MQFAVLFLLSILSSNALTSCTGFVATTRTRTWGKWNNNIIDLKIVTDKHIRVMDTIDTSDVDTAKVGKTRRQYIQNSTSSTVFAFLTALFLPGISAQTSNASNLPSSTGADTSKTGTIDTLIPIVQLRFSLSDLLSQITNTFSPDLLENVQQGNIPTDETSFKKLFDGYSDPVSYKQKFVDQNAFLVYYSKGFDGPGRANIESDLPTKQTLQYGARNDAWVAMDEFLVELSYAAKQENISSSRDDYDKEDLLQPLKKAIQSIDNYLNLAPEEDLKEAMKRVSTNELR
jgi:hypothetical protein